MVVGLLKKLLTKKPSRTALIVDDEPHVLSLLKTYLENMEFEVISAGNTAEAMEKVEKYKKFNLIILDLVMPDGSGLALAKKIRKKPGTLKTPIIIVSGDVPPEKMAECKDSVKYLDVMTKPFKMGPFKKTVNDALETGFKKKKAAAPA